jgi:predicted PurR-regulated permease PerM
MDEISAQGRPLFSPSRLEPKTVMTACFVVLLIGLLVYVAWKTPVAIAITFVSALLAVALDRPIQWLQRRGVKRGLAIGTILLIAVLVVAAIAVLLIPALVRQARGLFGLLHELPTARLKALWTQHAEAIAERALSYVGSAVQVIAALLATLVVTIFMLVFGRDATDRLLREVVPNRRSRYQRMLHDAYASIGGYLSGLGVIMLCNTAVMSIFLVSLRVPYFLPLGVFSGLSVIIPNVGAAVAGVILTAAAYAFGGLWKAIATLSFFVVYKIIEGDVLQPAVFRRTVNLNPLATLLAVLFMTELAGVIGAFIAVPLLGILQIVLRELLALRRDQRGLLSRGKEEP